MAVAAADMPAV